MLKNQAKKFEKLKFFIFRKIAPNSFYRSEIGPKAICYPEHRLGTHFDLLHAFQTTFQKSNFRAPKALFAFWRLRRLEIQAFHGLQNIVGASSK